MDFSPIRPLYIRQVSGPRALDARPHPKKPSIKLQIPHASPRKDLTVLPAAAGGVEVCPGLREVINQSAPYAHRELMSLTSQSTMSPLSDDLLECLGALGEGAGGVVHKVRDTRTQKVLARKTIATRAVRVCGSARGGKKLIDVHRRP
jgi:hypothetical protein